MAATEPAITDSSRLVALLYRADWRQLCLSAEVSTRVNGARVVRPAPGRKSQERADVADRANPRETWRLATETGAEDGTDVADDAGAADDTGAEGQPRWPEGLSRVLIAPGGRCRIENAAPRPDQLVVCDGEKWWRATPDEAIGLRALSRPADYAELLYPSWLISRFGTELIGPAEAAGRPAYRIAATPRPIAATGTLDRGRRIDRVDVLVDMELGILLCNSPSSSTTGPPPALSCTTSRRPGPATRPGSGSRSRPGYGWWKHQACSTTSTSPDQSRRPGPSARPAGPGRRRWPAGSGGRSAPGRLTVKIWPVSRAGNRLNRNR
jgi:hypothetical protein